MGVHSSFVLVCFLFVVSFCSADDPTVDIVGAAECADCQQNNFKTSQAFSGLHVTIDCKLKSGDIRRIGDTQLDEGGEFKISVGKEIIQHLKKECYAQLHNAAASPCPAHHTTKILIKSQTHHHIIFTPAEPLRFSTALCTSKFLWPLLQYPPLPKVDPWKKKWPKITIPPLVNYAQPWMLPPLSPPLPIYKPPIFKPPTKPLPPFYKPMPKPPLPPVYKPLPKPPLVKPLPPVYKPLPKPPLVKPLPPVYKPLPKPPLVKPLPPVYKPLPKPPLVKPLPPIYNPIPKPLPPPLPIYKPPVVTKPLPPPFPLFPLPPFHKKKPCPPFTKIPPKFEHPKFGYFPKPPFYSNP